MMLKDSLAEAQYSKIQKPNNLSIWATVSQPEELSSQGK